METEKWSTVKLIAKMQEDFFTKVPSELSRKYTNSYGVTHTLKFLKEKMDTKGKFKNLKLKEYKNILFDFHQMILEEITTKGYVFKTCIGQFYCQKIKAYSDRHYKITPDLNYEHSNYKIYTVRWKKKNRHNRNAIFYSFRLSPLSRKRISQYARAQKIVSVVLKDTYYGSMGIFQRNFSKDLQRSEPTDTSEG